MKVPPIIFSRQLCSRRSDLSPTTSSGHEEILVVPWFGPDAGVGSSSWARRDTECLGGMKSSGTTNYDRKCQTSSSAALRLGSLLHPELTTPIHTHLCVKYLLTQGQNSELRAPNFSLLVNSTPHFWPSASSQMPPQSTTSSLSPPRPSIRPPPSLKWICVSLNWFTAYQSLLSRLPSA